MLGAGPGRCEPGQSRWTAAGVKPAGGSAGVAAGVAPAEAVGAPSGLIAAAPRRRPTSGRLGVAAALASYVALGVLANLPAWLDGATRTTQAAAQGDIGQEVWFLGWVPAALSHGLDPFVTGALNAPWGVNLMDNTAMPLAGLLGWPVTAIFGPIATYNVLFSLAFATSAAAAFLVFRRYVDWTPAAWLGGLLFGCSPYLVGQGRGHLFLVLVALLPAMLWCLDEIVVRRRRPAWRMGGLLGACAVAQLGFSVELLAWACVMAAVGLAGLAVVNRHRVAERAGHVARALATAVAVFAAAAAFPLYVFFAGPDHLSGAVHPPAILDHLSADVASFIVPTSNQRLDAGLAKTGDGYVALVDGPVVPEPAENGSYLGLPLVVLLAAGAVRFRRDRTLRFALAMALVAAVFSLGGHLRVGGHDLGVPLPYLLLRRAGVLSSGIAARFSVFMWLFVALAVAVIVDRYRAARRGRTAPAGRLRRLAGPAAGAVLLAASCAALVPAWPYTFGPAYVPAWFASPAARHVRAGATVLPYPVARASFSLPMVWQALDGYRYGIPGGEAAVTDPHVSRLERILWGCLVGTPNPPVGPHLVTALRAELRARRVTTVVVPGDLPGAPCARGYLEAVLRRPPVEAHGASVWRGVLANVSS